jgi:excisionase family DNA binding protein
MSADAHSPADSTSPETERLLTPGEVAQLFRVDPKTVTRWAAAGRLGSHRTLGVRPWGTPRSSQRPGGNAFDR